MAQEIINIGSADAKQGDSLFAAFTKTNNNFDQLFDSDPKNEVVVNQESDFPAPVAGVITLLSNTNYIIGGTITTANRFVVGDGTTLTSRNPFFPAIIYTGSDTMFTGADTNFALDRIGISCPSGKCFDFSSSPGQGSTFGLNIVSIFQCDSVGNFDNLRSINWTNSSAFSANQGIVISGTDNWEVLSIIRMGLTTSNTSFVGLDLTNSIHRSVEINNYVLNGVSGSVGISGSANSANITANFVASVAQCEFISPVTPLSGIDEDDIRYSFLGNSGIPNSTVSANPYLTTQTTVTINTAGVYEKINQSNWNSTVSTRVQITADGDIINLLEDEIKVQLTGTCTVEKVGGGNDLITARLVYNDDPTNSESAITEVGTQNGQPTNISLTGVFILQPGDSISIYVANQGSTSNIIVDYAKFSVLRLL
jgi:hypothetical protein